MRKQPVAIEPPDDSHLDLGDNSRCNNTALRKATRRVSQLYDSVLAPTGLRSTQRSILLNIARFGSPTMGQLASSLVLDRSALGHNLKPLERNGFVVLDVDPDDKRNRLAKLTRKGESKLRETTALWQEAQKRFERKFGVERAASLRKALAVIAAEEFDDAFEAPTTSPTAKARPKSQTTN
ncbi:MarR family winged helix-turn-helix transcriptional regulator [Bradyrhizobium sp. McL0616]|uniref:MarR family winged helix-turn-helix transcriptional regulator n=1 Tax=Bradyrhizobium sp. McL0616 TaxID=3415674 RepID=UPI003CFBBC35